MAAAHTAPATAPGGPKGYFLFDATVISLSIQPACLPHKPSSVLHLRQVSNWLGFCGG